MFTSLIPLTFFNEYIISPKTWLHYFKDWQKSFMILLCLSLFYYFNIIYIIIITMISLIILINLPIPSKKFILSLNNILISFFFINILLCINHKNKYNIYNIFPETNIKLIISKFFIRSILIPITCNLYLKILFLTTQYEAIILSILSYIQNHKNIHYKKIIFILALSSQLILLISQQISFLYINIIMQNIPFTLKTNSNHLLFTFYRNLSEFSYFQITRISYIMQVKKINYVNFSIIKIK